MVLEGVIPQIGLGEKPIIKIKLEVDVEPPLGFETKEKLLLRPFSKEDISRFIPDPKVLNIWSAQYFLDLIEMLKMK